MKFEIPSYILNHKRMAHGGIYYVRKRNSKIVDFSTNVNPLGPPKSVIAQLNKFNFFDQYPDPDSQDLRVSLQQYSHVPKSQILVGNGATEIIYNFCKTFLNSKKQVLIHIPTFGEYEAASKLSGAKILFYHSLNLQNDFTEFLYKIPKNGCVFVCNPNNPTGTIIDNKSLTNLVKEANDKQTIVFVDECFIEFTDPKNSIKNLVKNYENLLVLRSLTKFFALAGVRLGYAIGSQKIISILNNVKIPWNVSTIAQKAGTCALKDKSYFARTRKLIKQESKFLIDEISKIEGFDCFDTCTNFILIKTKTHSKKLQKLLLNKHILIRDCSTFRGLNHSYVRIAIKDRKENNKLIKALKTL